MKYHRAQDTFVADLKDGTSVRVVKGEVLPEGHELVKRDSDGAGSLFRPLQDAAEDEQPKDRPGLRGRAAKLWHRPRRAIACGSGRRH